MARWITGLSKWVVTFTFRFCCGGTGAGSGGGGRALLAAAARRTSSSCFWICCWIRTSSPSRPCWGTSQGETGRSSNRERTTGRRAGWCGEPLAPSGRVTTEDKQACVSGRHGSASIDLCNLATVVISAKKQSQPLSSGAGRRPNFVWLKAEEVTNTTTSTSLRTRQVQIQSE